MKLFNPKQLDNIKMSSRDETRQALNGLFFEGNSTIATDGHKLMRVTFTPKPLPDEVIEKELGKDYLDHPDICESYALEKYNEKNLEEWPANGIAWANSDKSFILPRSTVEKALKNIPKKASIPLLKNVAIGLKENNGGETFKAVCQTTDLENIDNVEARLVDGKFPDYKQVIPDFKGSANYQRVIINAKYLKEICTQLEKYNDSSHAVTLYLKKDKLSCVVNDPEHPNSNPFLMPEIKTESGEHFSMGIIANDDEGTEATAVLMPMRL